jgi:pyridoxamine 5'-phosphate oxidase
VDLSEVRESYENRGIDESDLAADPITQFQHWYAEISSAAYWEPNAMVIGTVDADGRPAARNVLLKGADPNGFLFFTNYTSDKAADLDRNGFAVLAFNWTEVRRQVIIRGSAERVSESESDKYWSTRSEHGPLTKALLCPVGPALTTHTQFKPAGGRIVKS